ncbi:hypothetical protein GLOTRDRAFT_92054 [Gloeophyllum trabeum ATCC 11539]|uniref:DUF6534 domain-containing protein n=1 Tax=Gloeophyllum trabeum (strain ATCC 11539 / FP-39264 / Madison 617) TaxID=670483 RepID=S7QBW1_GLOTA|nr:uncharacterized protein GLOTRDRAFT_92054 [Gloeophyllum trabeum ATCC 11539]EPQ56832.1 hypothetical protein GLOTRDRAFT_92054 [Gloeophyllum trabeum ATCC 11539]
MSTPAPPALDNSLGAILIGVICASALYGLSCLQTFQYLRAYRDDRFYLKALVLILWCLDTLHSAFTCHALYYYAVTMYGNYLALATANWWVPVALNVCIGSLVQMYMGWRVFIRLFVPGPVCLFCFQPLVLLCKAMTVIGFRVKEFANLKYYKGIITTSLASTAVVDLVIAASLCYFLSKKRTGFSKTDDLINTLIIYSVNSGVLTSVFKLPALNLIYDHSLNARKRLRKYGNATPLELSDLPPASNLQIKADRLSQHPVRIQTETSTLVRTDPSAVYRDWDDSSKAVSIN